MKLRPLAAAAAAGCLALTGCSGSSGSGDQRLTVFAAASLTEAYGTLEKSFEKSHPGVDVVVSYGSSSDLAEQVNQGSPADVLATASGSSMDIATEARSMSGEPEQFTTNTLIIVTPPDNPGHVTGVDSLSSVDYVMCDPSVPCGDAGAEMLKKAGVKAHAKSYEEDVKAVLTRVTTGEADAGIVYVSDAHAAGDKVHSVEIPSDVNVVNDYVIGVTAEAPEPHLAQEWVDLTQSAEGQQVLKADGLASSTVPK